MFGELRSRILITLFVLFAWCSVYHIIDMARDPIESSFAVSQLEDSKAIYVASRAAAQGFLYRAANIVLLLVLAAIWLPLVVKHSAQLFKKNSNSAMALLLAVSVLMLSSCIGPYQKEIAEEIGTNETALLVPLEGASKSGQGVFMSVEYLNQNKVAAKRITMATLEMARKIDQVKFPNIIPQGTGFFMGLDQMPAGGKK